MKREASAWVNRGYRSIDVTLTFIEMGMEYVVKPVEYVNTDKAVGEPFIDPSLKLTSEQAQQLIDGLWMAGLRPTSVGTEGQLAATEGRVNDAKSYQGYLQKTLEYVLMNTLGTRLDEATDGRALHLDLGSLHER